VNPLPRTLDSFDGFNFFNFKTSGCTGPVQTIQPLTAPPVCGIRLALVASTSAMSDFANDVIGGLALTAAFGAWLSARHLSCSPSCRRETTLIVSVKLDMVSTALQFEAVVAACAPSRGTSAANWTFGIVHAHRYRIGIPMWGELTLTSLPTDTLLDIVFFLRVGGQPLPLSESRWIEQIQLELQRRGELDGARLCQTAIGLGDLW